MKIGIVGPVLPYRSGIARHTTALATELAEREGVHLSVLSFSRQYPRLLYPGEVDKDSDASIPGAFKTHYSIDTINPWTWWKAARSLARDLPDFVLMPAWTFFVAPCMGSIARSLRRSDIPIAMIVHNAVDHEAAGWKTHLSRFQLLQADMFVTHNPAIASQLLALAPDRPILIQPHPVFHDYPKSRGLLPRRSKLELLFFGLIRPYKGLDVALHGLARSNLRDVHLSVVGEFWGGKSATENLVKQLGLETRVDIVDRYVSDADAAEYFNRCDAVLTPYHSASGSGVLALACHYGKPVVATNVPGLSDAVRHGQTGWLFPAGDRDALARLLQDVVTRESSAAMGPMIHEARRQLRWDSFVDGVLEWKSRATKPKARGELRN